MGMASGMRDSVCSERHAEADRPEIGDPGHVASWMGPARKEAHFDRVTYRHEHYRNCPCTLYEGEDTDATNTNDHVWLQFDQLLRERLRSTGVAADPPKVDLNIAIGPATGLEALRKCDNSATCA